MAAAVDPPGSAPLPSHLVEHEKDPNGNQRGYIKGTDYSIPYSSPWSRIHDQEVRNNLLRHVNCGYLSTAGSPPTLLALKQHAQSLCILIQALNPTLSSGEIMMWDPTQPKNPQNATPGPREKTATTAAAPPGSTPREKPKKNNPRAIAYKLNDAFDFLSDLSVPYTNDDPNHHKPLVGLLNEIRGVHEAFGADSHCPLMTVKPRGSDERVRMYANHHNLVMHTNACLERLDHEFSPVGGLLGLLPVESEDPEGEDLAKARSSIFGQWLLFTQHLVARMHELERSYGNALDALSGEAAVPYQYIESLGTEGRNTGRQIAFPQDRYLLVNAGDEVFETIHTLLDKQEEIHQIKAALYRRNGVLSDSASAYMDTSDPRVNTGADGTVVSAEDGGYYSRGLIPVTIPTRYYRLAGRGNSTVFIIPAYQTHPSVEYTRQLEDKPSIISSFQPAWPKRASELEKDYQARLDGAKILASENAKLKEKLYKVSRESDSAKKTLGDVLKVRDLLLLTLQGKPAPTEEDKEKRVPAPMTGLETEFARTVEQLRQRAETAEGKLVSEIRARKGLEETVKTVRKVKDALVNKLLDAGMDADVDPVVEEEVVGASQTEEAREAESDKLYERIERNDPTLGFDASKAWTGHIRGYRT